MKRLLSLATLMVSAGVYADVAYDVTVDPTAGTLHVKVQFPKADNGLRIQIPNWAPGSYRLADTFKNVQNFKATSATGTALTTNVEMTTTPKTYGDGADRKTIQNPICTWVVGGAPTVVVEYDLNMKPVDGALNWSGPSTYIYAVDRLKEACTLSVHLPTGWSAYTGLDPKGSSATEFVAPDYDVLADNPVSTGDVTVDTYVSRGKTHTIVMRGKAREKVDRAYLIKACKFVTDAETDFFGGKAPYNRYVWHFSVNDAADGAGGLEHLSSTQISLAAGVGPRAVSVLAHEFFHLWNVKRIRSSVLGPFDYTKLPETGAIWWLEGVTDYYSHTFLYRYGWWTEDAYFKDAVSNVNTVRRNPAHTEISPYDSSLRVGEASEGRGNSNGYKISYYNQGWVVGMLLDIEMRAQTNGRRSLDDVEHALWDLCKDNKPGFQEDEIRKQLVRFGGAPMGAFYDQIILKPGDMIDQTLAKAGLRLFDKPENYTEWASPGSPIRCRAW